MSLEIKRVGERIFIKTDETLDAFKVCDFIGAELHEEYGILSVRVHLRSADNLTGGMEFPCRDKEQAKQAKEALSKIYSLLTKKV